MGRKGKDRTAKQKAADAKRSREMKGKKPAFMKTSRRSKKSRGSRTSSSRSSRKPVATGFIVRVGRGARVLGYVFAGIRGAQRVAYNLDRGFDLPVAILDATTGLRTFTGRIDRPFLDRILAGQFDAAIDWSPDGPFQTLTPAVLGEVANYGAAEVTRLIPAGVKAHEPRVHVPFTDGKTRVPF